MEESLKGDMEGIMPVFCDRSLAKFQGHHNKVEYSHKLTEKRRRDRMNMSMSEIAQLLPSSSVSKQLEKAEILEKTITYIKKLQEITGKQELKTGSKPDDPKAQENQDETLKDGHPPTGQAEVNSNYYVGFRDCIKEVFHCLTNVEAMDLQQPCFKRLMGHLQNELQFMSESEDGGDAEHGHQGDQQNSLSSSKAVHDTWGCKRSHESTENTGTQHEASSSDTPAKRPHIDNSTDSNESSLCSQGSSLYQQESESSSSSFGQRSNGHKKEKQKVSLGADNLWVGNGSPNSNVDNCNVSQEKEKEEGHSSSNMINRANIDAGSGCGNESDGGNHKWLSNGLNMPMFATPISPRTPYIPNPYTAPTYALHPSGTHYIPVVLHLNIPLPPFPEMNASLNPVPNMAALNYMRMGSLQYPYLPYGMPFVPPVPGVHNPKQEPNQKQCESESREVDSSPAPNPQPGGPREGIQV